MLTNTFSFSDTDRLVSRFERIHASPYRNYGAFRAKVSEMIATEPFLREEMADIARLFRETRVDERKVALVKNCPIDRDVPVYDPDDPVRSKHMVKKTFVGEVLLEVVSQACGLPILSYTTRNDGDFFQDVYAQKKYSDTQTQKTDSDLYFHNDRTAHRVRADVLCLLGMRSDPANVINTKYVHGTDLLHLVDPELHDILRQPNFATPFDLISQDSNEFQVNSDNHPILIGESAFRYYDVRTTVAASAPAIAWRALAAVKDAITKAPKLNVPIQTGELFIFPNLEGLHSRDKAHVPKPEAARERYLLKTYNFWDESRRDAFADLYVEGLPGLVDDARIDGARIDDARIGGKPELVLA